MFYMSIFLTKLFKLNHKDKIAVVVETVMQNGGIGIVIGALIFDNTKFLFPVAAYALLQYLFVLIYFTYIKIQKKTIYE